MTKSKISKADREALVARGFVEGNAKTIPENISPVVKAQLLAEMDEDASGSTPGEAGGPEALAQRNALHHSSQGNRRCYDPAPELAVLFLWSLRSLGSSNPMGSANGSY